MHIMHAPESRAEPGTESPAIRTKAARHDRIAHILTTRAVTSQAELAKLLAESGIATTQATLSRDLVEINAQKVRAADGSMVYAVPAEGAGGMLQGARAPLRPEHLAARFERLCEELVVTAERTANLLVLRTPAGAAPYLAAALDQSFLAAVLGSIAGDDTVLIIVREDSEAEALRQRILRAAGVWDRAEADLTGGAHGDD